MLFTPYGGTKKAPNSRCYSHLTVERKNTEFTVLFTPYGGTKKAPMLRCFFKSYDHRKSNKRIEVRVKRNSIILVDLEPWKFKPSVY